MTYWVMHFKRQIPTLVLLGLSLQISLAAQGAPAVTTPLTPAAHCEKDMSFDAWLNEFKHEALANGISRATLASAAADMSYDMDIIHRDRGQSVFQQSFLQFSDRMASAGRIQMGAKLIQKNAAFFAQIEKKYGVPAQVIVAFWALESDFGANTGKTPIIRAATTLAYDCRRADFFRAELMDALRLIERGDIKESEMLGSWAAELGGTQLTPSDYYKYAVDFEGTGHADIMTSVPDTLASSANFLMNLGWKAGQPWIQEVHVPANLPWQEADLAIQHPVSDWIKLGVTPAYGTFPVKSAPASLILPMGRFGPAFLAYDNFQVFLGWNASMVYSTTASYLAMRMAGAPAVGRGTKPVTPLTTAQMLELQTLLASHGYDIATPDGKFGNSTRAAVKQAQIKLGLPADSYPSVELISALHAAQ